MIKQIERILKGLNAKIEAKIDDKKNLMSVKIELEHLLEELNEK